MGLKRECAAVPALIDKQPRGLGIESLRPTLENHHHDNLTRQEELPPLRHWVNESFANTTWLRSKACLDQTAAATHFAPSLPRELRRDNGVLH